MGNAEDRNIPEMVTIGRVVGLYGVCGWLRVYSYTQPREGLLDYCNWRLSVGNRRADMVVESSKRQGKGLIAKLQGVADRDQARLWLGCDIQIPRHDLPALHEGEYYWVDLIGARVLTVNGVELGELDYLLETGANDVMVVSGERERLVPFVVGSFVTNVDLQQGVIEVDWDPEF